MNNMTSLETQFKLSRLLQLSQGSLNSSDETAVRGKKRWKDLRHGKVRRHKSGEVDSLPISSEMVEILSTAVGEVDHDGYLNPQIAHVQFQPLSMESVYFPLAATLNSKHTALRSAEVPYRRPIGDVSSREEGDMFATSSPQIGFSDSLVTESMSVAPPSRPSSSSVPSIHDLDSRLKVLWLRRKAQLEHGDGRLAEALQCLGAALREHLGSDDYLQANLLGEKLSDNPQELMAIVQTEYALYDVYAHSCAGRIQRCYWRYVRRRHQQATNIARIYRGHRVRHALRRMREIQRQCAVLIQRRFRRHLKRMHMLATMIKRWFQLRKEVKAFQRRLLLFRAARRIQAWWRGVVGRLIAAYLRRRWRAAKLLQRVIRGFLVRAEQAYIISRIHRYYYLSARVIQSFVRRKQAVERARLKLLMELLREDVRLKKERIVLDELLRLEKIRYQFYRRSRPGALHRRFQQRKLFLYEEIMHQQYEETARSAAAEYTAEGLSFVNPEVIKVLDQFDEYDDGRVLTIRLPSMLRALCIPIDAYQVLQLQSVLDPDDTGCFDITQFLSWYDSEAADDFLEPTSASRQAEVHYLRHIHPALLKVKDLLSSFLALTLEESKFSRMSPMDRRLCRELVTKHWRKHYLAVLRTANPPKYECCQCRDAFALFSDYFRHFDDQGLCSRTTLKGLFFRKHWIHDQWTKQRQIEQEIIRVNDQYAFVRYSVRKTCFHEYVCFTSSSVRKHFREGQKPLLNYYLRELSSVDISDKRQFFATIVNCVMQVLQCSATKVVSDMLLNLCASFFRTRLKDAWLMNETATIEEVKDWLSAYAEQAAKPSSQANAKKSQANQRQASTAKETVNTPFSPLRAMITNQSVYFIRSGDGFPLSAFLQADVTKQRIVRRWAHALAFFVCRLLHMMITEAQATIQSLLECRGKRPRRLDVSDKELQELGLHSLTWQQFTTEYESPMQQLQLINAFIDRLHKEGNAYAEELLLSKAKNRFLWVQQILQRFSRSYQPVLPTEEARSESPAANGQLTPSASSSRSKQRLYQRLHEQSTWARAMVNIHSRSSIGKRVDKRWQWRYVDQLREQTLLIAQQHPEAASHMKSLLARIFCVFFLQQRRSTLEPEDMDLFAAEMRYALLATPSMEERQRTRGQPPNQSSEEEKESLLPHIQVFHQLLKAMDDSGNEETNDEMGSLDFARVKHYVLNATRPLVFAKARKVFGSLWYLHAVLTRRDRLTSMQLSVRQSRRLQVMLFDSLPTTLGSMALTDQRKFWQRWNYSFLYSQFSSLLPAPSRTALRSSSNSLAQESLMFQASLSEKEAGRGGRRHQHHHNLKVASLPSAYMTPQLQVYHQLMTLHLQQEQREYEEIVSFIEKQMESRSAWRLFGSWRGYRHINYERQLWQQMQTLCSAYCMVASHCQGATVGMTTLLLMACLQLICRCFDVSCEGKLDEQEWRQLLRFFHTAMGSSSTFTSRFASPASPDYYGLTTKDYMQFMSMIKENQELSNLNEKLFSVLSAEEEPLMMLEQLVHPNIFCTVRLIALQTTTLHRRMARKQLEQSVEISSGGQVGFPLIASAAASRSSKLMSLTLRAQIQAMRQLQHYLRKCVTAQLTLRIRAEQLQEFHTRTLLPQESDRQPRKQGEEEEERVEIDAKTAMLYYAFLLHCEHEQFQVLDTELIHLLSYLLNYCTPLTRDDQHDGGALQQLLQMAEAAAQNDRVHWLPWQKLHGLLDACFTLPAEGRGWQPMYARDAEVQMMSQCRQQAVLLVLAVDDIDGRETNDRCTLLGVYDMVGKGLHRLRRRRSSSERGTRMFDWSQGLQRWLRQEKQSSSADGGAGGQKETAGQQGEASQTAEESHLLVAWRELAVLRILANGHSISDIVANKHLYHALYLSLLTMRLPLAYPPIPRPAAAAVEPLTMSLDLTDMHSICRDEFWRRYNVVGKISHATWLVARSPILLLTVYQRSRRLQRLLMSYGIEEVEKFSGQRFLKEVVSGVSFCAYQV